jgi:hypothetical protein
MGVVLLQHLGMHFTYLRGQKILVPMLPNAPTSASIQRTIARLSSRIAGGNFG